MFIYAVILCHWRTSVIIFRLVADGEHIVGTFDLVIKRVMTRHCLAAIGRNMYYIHRLREVQITPKVTKVQHKETQFAMFLNHQLRVQRTLVLRDNVNRPNGLEQLSNQNIRALPRNSARAARQNGKNRRRRNKTSLKMTRPLGCIHNSRIEWPQTQLRYNRNNWPDTHYSERGRLSTLWQIALQLHIFEEGPHNMEPQSKWSVE